MRRAHKNPQSALATGQLRYISGNKENNKKIAEALLTEQKRFCAYTDEFISRTDAADIEHFNPQLKNTAEDNYHNWFLVKHQWNNEKSNKWDKFQPILHPTAPDFEERIVYKDGDYIAHSNPDQEAQNLVKLLQLDNAVLADNRKKYIKRKREEINAFAQDAESFFTALINDDPCRIIYPRAIKEEFGIDLWERLG